MTRLSELLPEALVEAMRGETIPASVVYQRQSGGRFKVKRFATRNDALAFAQGCKLRGWAARISQ